MVEPHPSAPYRGTRELLDTAENSVRRTCALLSELGDAPAFEAATDFGDNDEALAWSLCARAPVNVFDAQRMLETDDPVRRLELLVELSDALARTWPCCSPADWVERAGLLSLLATGLRARRRLRSRTVGSGAVGRLRAGPGWPHADTRDGLAMVRDDAGVFFLVLHDGAVIGDCGTHGAPDAQGSVEIGFGLAAPSGVTATAVSWPRPSPTGSATCPGCAR